MLATAASVVGASVTAAAGTLAAPTLLVWRRFGATVGSGASRVDAAVMATVPVADAAAAWGLAGLRARRTAFVGGVVGAESVSAVS